jgi:hypothetical protein
MRDCESRVPDQQGEGKGKIRLLVAESGKVAVFKPTLFLHADWSLLTLDPSDLKASTGPSFSPLVFPLLSHVLPFKIPIFRIWKTGNLMCCVCPSRATSISQVLSRLGLLEVLNLPPHCFQINSVYLWARPNGAFRYFQQGSEI